MEKIFLDAALRYCDEGRSVIPIKPRDKIPFIKWEPYQSKRAEPDQIKEWWQKWPNANVALITGRLSGIDAIDADSSKGYSALIKLLPTNFLTPESQTPKGRHLFVEHTDGLGNATRFIEDCDYRGEGGYIIVPPSLGANGEQYSWLPGKSIFEIAPTPLPEVLYMLLTNVLRGDNNNYSDNKRQQTTTPDNICFEKGHRDNTLFHLANCLIKGGMLTHDIQQLLTLIALKLCNPSFPEKEIPVKIESALKRTEGREKSFINEIRDLIVTTNGIISTTFVFNRQHLTTREEKKKAVVALLRLEKEGLIEKTGKVAGEYRKIDNECEVMDFQNAETESIRLNLLFGISEMVEIMPGNIILIAGEPNAGKTAFLLNTIKDNMHNFDINYFNSEMGASELRKRLTKFEYSNLSDWKFRAWERVDNFSDVIKSGNGQINVIDFLEIHDNFYEVGGKLAEIHKKLKGAIAIIALQKNKGVDVGLGGLVVLT